MKRGFLRDLLMVFAISIYVDWKWQLTSFEWSIYFFLLLLVAMNMGFVVDKERGLK